MGKVIAFANQKGGVGKSTLTVQAAFYLRKHRKKKVLVIDIDSQGNTTESLTQGQPYTATSSAALFEPNLEELGIFDDTPYDLNRTRMRVMTSKAASWMSFAIRQRISKQ